jgi:hypothetical protein
MNIIIIIIYIVFLKSGRVDTELHYKEDYITEGQHPSSPGTFEGMILSITIYDTTHCTLFPGILKRQLQV